MREFCPQSEKFPMTVRNPNLRRLGINSRYHNPRLTEYIWTAYIAVVEGFTLKPKESCSRYRYA
jgi:hypothetical protein